MKKWLLVVLALALLVGPTAAEAASPHFLSGGAQFSGTNLQVFWREAGLGDNQLITYQATADATAVYGCINGGSNHPQASNKETVNGPVSAMGTFDSGKNGNISASLFLAPPGPGAFYCPPGQTMVLGSVSYTNVSVTDVTNGVTLAIAGTFQQTFVSF